MVPAGPFEPNAAHWYDDADRRDQLHRLAGSSDELAVLFESRSFGEAASYRFVARAAEQLASEPFDPKRAAALVSRLPTKPVWLDPRDPRYQGLREKWHEEVADAWHEVERATLELRAFATYDRT